MNNKQEVEFGDLEMASLARVLELKPGLKTIPNVVKYLVHLGIKSYGLPDVSRETHG